MRAISGTDSTSVLATRPPARIEAGSLTSTPTTNPGATHEEPPMARIEKHVVRTVVSLPETATLCDAIRVMHANGIGALGVRRDEKLVGLVTERGVLGAIAGGAD